MKDLIKIEALRLKMPTNMRPKAHEMRQLVIYHGDHVVNEKRIEKMKEILTTEYENAVAFLDGRKSSFVKK